MQQDNNDRLMDVWLEPTKCLFGCLAFCGFFFATTLVYFSYYVIHPIFLKNIQKNYIDLLLLLVCLFCCFSK